MKNTVPLFAFLLSLSVFSPKTMAQEVSPLVNFSQADELLLQKAVADDPGLLVKYLVYEGNLKQLLANPPAASSKTDTLINGRRIIPVVFHIIHKGGPENISKDQILDAINLINQDYNKLNSDTGSADSWPAFAPRRADCKIEFRLARIDPYGNCTEGIIRHYDPQTNYAYFTTMTDYAWPPSRYMNIFAVNFIYPEGITVPEGGFIGGMSPFPPSNPLTQALTGGDTLADGILIRHDGLGSIGTATTLGGMPINALNRTFTHESGHYFNLYHPFQNLMFGLIPASSGCPSFLAPNGDEVNDTPPIDVATQNTGIICFVPGSRNTCNQDNPDEPDMIENYMDYQWGYCTNIFTLGQYARMDATLNGDRRKLWSLENLIATGVLVTAPSLCRPIADFYAAGVHICAGSNVTFSDNSYQGAADAWNWTFDGGTPGTSSQQNPVIQYNTPGTYDVKLVASNANGSDSLTRQAYIHVHDPSVATAAPFVESFESGSLNGWSITNDVGNTWEITTAAAFTGTQSLKILNFDNNQPGSSDEIVSPVYDLTALPPGVPPALRFRLAYAGKRVAGTIVTPEDTVYDRLRIYTSANCGATWSQKYSKNGIALTSVSNTPDNFTPDSASHWKYESVLLPVAYLSENDVMLKFVFESNGGNNIYIDDININSVTAGTGEDNIRDFDVMVFPNPVQDHTTLSFRLPTPQEVNIILYDAMGRVVWVPSQTHYEAGAHQLKVPLSGPGTSGFYLLKTEAGNRLVIKKIIAN